MCFGLYFTTVGEKKNCAILCISYLFICPKVHLSIEMTDLNVARSHSSMNIENLTSIPVGGSITLINYAHRHLPTEYSPTKDRGWAWVVCAGSFFVMFMVYGIHTSFGVLLVVLLDHFDSNKASTGKKYNYTAIQNRTAGILTKHTTYILQKWIPSECGEFSCD